MEGIGSLQRSFEWYHPRLPTTSSSPRLGFTTPTKTPIASLLSQEWRHAFQIFYAHSKTFRAVIYKANGAVIFAIAQLSC